MMFNKLTFNFALGLLAATGLYALLYSGMAGLLFASAVALIAAAFLDEVEFVAAATVICVILYTFLSKRYSRFLEPFQNQDKESQEIISRLAKMEQEYTQEQQSPAGPCRAPAGVYNPSVEGFANPNSAETGIPKTGEGFSSNESPASVKSESVPQVDTKLASAVSANITNEDKKKKELQSASNGLFKLGQMPSEYKDGPKLDAGQTLINAMNSLDPNTISQMTDGTKQLLETQKNLMGMLKTMTPVLAEGRELLSTFSGMFSGGGGQPGGFALKV